MASDLNEAAPGSEAGGAYAKWTPSTLKDGAEVDIIDLESNLPDLFYPLSFPSPR